ncbi:hypothetical protein B7P43_G18247 [Cryptotermes secundus]|uniref:DUF4817 domain-containing protein n=1 Tax=Cryptotermes secundus TaxID=105785 RepID=A0A2J7PTA1_9NEOP|nr:hypothetical protein B7P43_G18247 [Cryptotermes secundus]
MEYTVEQRVFLVRTYWVTGSIANTQLEFRRKFGVRKKPAKSTIQSLAQKLERAGTLLSERGKNRPEETIAIVRDRLLQYPKKSLRRLSQDTGYSYSTCQRAAKKANLRPYKITSVQELGDVDKDKRVRYCLWFREFVQDNPRILDITRFSDEAWFHLSGYVNAQNSRIWASENPHEIAESPLHPQKVGVWCAISGLRITGPIFFDTTVDSTLYCRIFYDFVQQLDDTELTQQDSATCHTSNMSMELSESFFPDRVISKKMWPPKSPDLTSPDFFLRGLLKDRVYANKPRTLQDLKDNISAEIRNITEETLQQVTAN